MSYKQRTSYSNHRQECVKAVKSRIFKKDLPSSIHIMYLKHFIIWQLSLWQHNALTEPNHPNSRTSVPCKADVSTTVLRKFHSIHKEKATKTELDDASAWLRNVSERLWYKQYNIRPLFFQHIAISHIVRIALSCFPPLHLIRFECYFDGIFCQGMVWYCSPDHWPQYSDSRLRVVESLIGSLQHLAAGLASWSYITGWVFMSHMHMVLIWARPHNALHATMVTGYMFSACLHELATLFTLLAANQTRPVLYYGMVGDVYPMQDDVCTSYTWYLPVCVEQELCLCSYNKDCSLRWINSKTRDTARLSVMIKWKGASWRIYGILFMWELSTHARSFAINLSRGRL